MGVENAMSNNKYQIQFVRSDRFLLVALVLVLIIHYTGIASKSVDFVLLAFFASIATLPVLYSAYQSLRNKKINIDLLAGVALLVSLLNQEWASAVFINLMLTSARVFSAYTQDRARNAIKSLLKLKPEKVRIKRDNSIIEMPIGNIVKDDLVVIELGERVSVDGVVVQGQAMIDQASLTGESLPVSKSIGDNVLSSTLIVSGSLVVRAEKVGKDTAFEKIIKLVEQSQKDKVGIQTTADKFASWYIAATFSVAIIVYLFTHNLALVLSILLVTCADDIAVAIPIAFSVAIANAAKRGIIIKGGTYLEGLTQAKTILVDKTGTLTKGRLKVEQIISYADFSQEKILELAASAECFSQHPVAKAIVNQAEKERINFRKSEDSQEVSGKGSTVILDGKEVVCGKMSFLRERGIVVTKEDELMINYLKQEELSVLIIGYDKKIIGTITLADEIRPEVEESINRLKQLGIKNIVMLTGDNEKVAQKVTKKLGLTGYYADLLPEDKLEYIKKYINKKDKVIMIGDGVNDAAALALSDVGIVMGAVGADSAIEAADIALMKDDFSKVPEVLEIGQSVIRIAKQNFWIWGIVNFVGLALIFAKVMGPEGAAAYNFITDFFPIANSMRLFEMPSFFSKFFGRK